MRTVRNWPETEILSPLGSTKPSIQEPTLTPAYHKLSRLAGPYPKLAKSTEALRCLVAENR